MNNAEIYIMGGLCFIIIGSIIAFALRDPNALILIVGGYITMIVATILDENIKQRKCLEKIEKK